MITFENLQNLPKKWRVGIFLLILIPVTILVLTLFLKPDIKIRQPFPIFITPTPIEISRKTVPPIVLPPSLALHFSARVAKNLHWLNNQELAYTVYDTNLKRNVVAKTEGINETYMLNNPAIKLSEFYWSDKNSLIIFDYQDPNRTYLLSPSGDLKNLSVQGYAYSWSPDGNLFFYRENTQDGKVIGKIYNVASGSSNILSEFLPEFQLSYWSPNNKDILLYNFSIDNPYNFQSDANQEERLQLYILEIESKSVRKIAINVNSPSWSPSGNNVAYLKENGLYLFTKENGETLLYKTNLSSQTISYTWLDNDRVILFNSSKTPPHPIIVSISRKTDIPFVSKMNLQNEQKVEFAISPDRKKLAVASEKDGLWFIEINLNQ